jgi:hypothetical protein
VADESDQERAARPMSHECSASPVWLGLRTRVFGVPMSGLQRRVFGVGSLLRVGLEGSRPVTGRLRVVCCAAHSVKCQCALGSKGLGFGCATSRARSSLPTRARLTTHRSPGMKRSTTFSSLMGAGRSRVLLMAKPSNRIKRSAFSTSIFMTRQSARCRSAESSFQL